MCYTISCHEVFTAKENYSMCRFRVVHKTQYISTGLRSGYSLINIYARVSSILLLTDQSLLTTSKDQFTEHRHECFTLQGGVFVK